MKNKVKELLKVMNKLFLKKHHDWLKMKNVNHFMYYQVVHKYLLAVYVVLKGTIFPSLL